MSAEIAPETPRLMTKSAYAAHRRVSPSLVTEWRKAGRLVMVGRLVDVAASDAALAQSLDRTRGGRGGKASRSTPTGATAARVEASSGPASTGAAAVAEPPSSTEDFQKHRARREGFAAKAAELDYRKSVGEVVEWSRADAALTAICSTMRRTAQRVPDALAARLAAEPDVRKVRAMLASELDQMLTDAANAIHALADQLGANVGGTP